jgi:E3 ubiquitin-protein ligase RAD18
MAAPFKNDSSNVSDSTDWIGTPLAVLEHVDSALRCQVCKDFYKTPMTTSCLHTFCSICIHRCLASDGQCPACRTKDQASKLKSNWVLEQVVDAFKHARPVALGYAIPSPIIDKRKIKETDFSTGDTEIPRKRTRSSNRTAKNLQELGAAVVQNDEARDDEDYVPGMTT